MIYFDARDDLQYMERLLVTFENIIEIEFTVRLINKAQGMQYLGSYDMFKRIREDASKSNPQYLRIRNSYARMIPRAISICQRENISCQRSGQSAPIEGNISYQGTIFELALNRPSDLVDIDTDLRDTVNKAIGAIQIRMSREWRQLINPLYWIGKAFVFLVKLPYNLLKLSGFDVDKIQEHLIARLFQLLYVIALILIFIHFGLNTVIDLGSFLAGVIIK
jgi:hypothetical protein